MKKIWTTQNQITLLESGDDYFFSILTSMDSAKMEIICFSYIFHKEGVGRKIAQKLKQASARGVEVHLVIDGVGSKELPLEFIADLEKSGVQIILFRPFNKVLKLGRIFFRRLHQKIIVIDQSLAFVGGINIDQRQYDQLDYAVLVQGPLALRIHKYVKLFLYRLKGDWFSYFRTRRQKLRGMAGSKGDVSAGFVIRDNFKHRRRIEEIYLNEIRRAKSSILIANAYFFPGRRFRYALQHAARRGVHVRLLLQGHTDHPIMRNAAALLYKEFINAGVEITEYHSQLLHAKVAVIDGRWSTVGSCNLDLFSLFLNLEANVVIDDERIAKQLQAKLEKAMRSGGVAMNSRHALSRSPWDWIISWLSLIVLRLVRFLSGA